jgi:hypothetical protein
MIRARRHEPVQSELRIESTCRSDKDGKAMGNTSSFGKALETVDRLPLEDQEALIEILHRRIIERRRAELAKDIQDAQKEFKAGNAHPVTPDELMAEILS